MYPSTIISLRFIALSSSDRSNWNEVSSNPVVGYRTSSNPSSRNGCSPSFMPSPLAGDIPIIRRHSGNLPTRCVTSQEPLSSLNVPQPNGGFFDPRRHSYGCSETASANSLLTVNICEGPFVTPLNARMTIHRNSTQSVQHCLHRQVIGSGLHFRYVWYSRKITKVPI
ncbi:hypothetical protein P879_02880 [Paragonimus westermani]|uniref:Uncharacterized protein n=1 Tax=Paragonimus westermani TaxID=34504 RepID=A0A8T0DVG4_9TREM|nr:hypothetical protein P879_02880 [Paragonimus westermani]